MISFYVSQCHLYALLIWSSGQAFNNAERSQTAVYMMSLSETAEHNSRPGCEFFHHDLDPPTLAGSISPQSPHPLCPKDQTAPLSSLRDPRSKQGWRELCQPIRRASSHNQIAQPTASSELQKSVLRLSLNRSSPLSPSTQRFGPYPFT